MIYVAAPYTHENSIIVDVRYTSTCAYVARLLIHKQWAYSPIVHCHHIAKDHNLPIDAEYWQDYNLHMLARSDALHVLLLDGWRESVGIRKEVRFWRACKHEPQVVAAWDNSRAQMIYEAEHFLSLLEPSEDIE